MHSIKIKKAIQTNCKSASWLQVLWPESSLRVVFVFSFNFHLSFCLFHLNLDCDFCTSSSALNCTFLWVLLSPCTRFLYVALKRTRNDNEKKKENPINYSTFLARYSTKYIYCLLFLLIIVRDCRSQRSFSGW